MQSSPEQMVVSTTDTQGVPIASKVFDIPDTPCADREKSTRRSPTSKDEFWDALSSNYDYLMDDGLIATCREASSDLSWDDEEVVTTTYHWSFTQFIENFKQLHDKLHDFQVAMQGIYKESHLEEQKKIAFLCANFNEQGQKLSLRYPAMRDEVHRHLNLLSNKWNAVVQSTDSKKVSPVKDSALTEITTLVRCLRRWLKNLEERVSPVSFSSKWASEKLQEKLKEQQNLQKEIKAKGKYVSALLSLCGRLENKDTASVQSPHLRWDAERFLRLGKNLQKRWHSIWLQSLECQYAIEGLLRENKVIACEKLDYSFTEEPLKKYPRLDCHDEGMTSDLFPSRLNTKQYCDDDDAIVKKSISAHLQNCEKLAAFSGRSPTNDKGVMVGNTGIAELKASCKGNIGKFEIVQDVGYSSETSAHFSNDEQTDPPGILQTLGESNIENAKINVAAESYLSTNCSSQGTSSSKSAVRRLFLTPDKYPSINLRKYFSLTETLATEPLGESKFLKSVPHSFYKMTSLDPEHSDDVMNGASNVNDSLKNLPKMSSHSTLHSNFSVLPNTDVLDLSQPSDLLELSKISVQSPSPTVSSNQSFRPESTQCEDVMPDSTSECHRSEKSKRTARVREWLSRCHSSEDITSDENPECRNKRGLSNKTIVNHSSDASGECTTDSDGEKSCGSDDVNNSLAFSQSFTGSVETVVKVAKDESKTHSDRAGSAEPSPCVQLRQKKKHNRGRPWSVTELNQLQSQTPRFLHSNSEGALNSMTYSPHNTKSTPSSKRLCVKLKRSSLTDISFTSATFTKAKHLASQSGSHTSTPHSDKSDGCFSSKDETTPPAGSFTDKSSSERKAPQSSDCHSVGSCNSSKSRGQRNKRRFRSSHSECSLKHRNHSDGSCLGQKPVTKGTVLTNKCTSNTSCPEDQSSVSDQVWDEYQDPPYLSEPYSEQTADEDQVKKLINFGDDYRAALGSQSDASSAKSTCKAPIRSRSKIVPHSIKESSIHHSGKANPASDSDTEDFHNILVTSLTALHFVQNCLKENGPRKNFALSAKFAELVATCETNLCHLHTILEELMVEPNCQSFSHCDLQKLRDLIEDWELLQGKLANLPQQNEQFPQDHLQASVAEVERTLAGHKGKLNAIWNCASEALSGLSTSEDLLENIYALQSALANLQEMKGAIISLNACILRLMVESGSNVVLSLRDAGAKLYQQWEDVYELSSSQLTKLQTLQQQWQEGKEDDNFARVHTPVLKIEEAISDDMDEHIPTGMIIDKGIGDLFSSPDYNLRIKEELETDDKLTYALTNAKSRLWRVLRASMPIHLALVISYWIACLMEPQCCDNMNNLEFSLFPQLRHMEGPPPV